MTINSMWFAVNGYPTKDNPDYAFIQPIVHAFADGGVRCTVIAPQSVTGAARAHKRPTRWIDRTDAGNEITVLQPKFVSASTLKVGGHSVSMQNRDRAIGRAVKSLSERPDAVYAHFWENAVGVAKATGGKVPVVVASGESTIRIRGWYTQKQIAAALPSVKGVIGVSSENIRASRENGLIAPDVPTTVLPNAADQSVFYPMDKAAVRQSLSIAEDSTVGVFVGTFCDRKGPFRVLEAAGGIDTLQLIFIGKGEPKPEGEQVIVCGAKPHDEIPKYLNAADFFVLPTKAEGSCNAVIEALSCGLPVITSDLPFNYDVLNKENAVLIDPENIADLHDAMKELCEDKERRACLSAAAIRTAEDLKIDVRIAKMKDFIRTCI